VTIAGCPADGVALPGFSLSHSLGWLACAIGEVFPVGVDIEAPAPQRDLPALAQQAFSERETAWLATQEHYSDAFYRLWCAKEALYKFRHNAGLIDTQDLTELDCGPDASGTADAFLHHETGSGYHLCLCSGVRPQTCAIERIEYSLLLNLSGG
ncbi:4'-phosphopantetheinyl transferase superfamily protein, partial [Herbaspirillum sp.]|uniref:4'-phosphopantetheinyl transferase family protein n=1 Tax=Herbaspirillum sp. TaxID=1890675 RepID=UPI0031CEB8DE